MTRDDEYIREILLEAEASDEPFIMSLRTLRQGPEVKKKNYHIDLLCDAGLMKPLSESSYRLTNQGHDYIEAIKNDTVWEKTKDGAAKVGGATLGMMKDMAIAYLRQEAAEKLGINL